MIRTASYAQIRGAVIEMFRWAIQARKRAEEYLSAAGRPLPTMWIVLLAIGSAAIFLLLMNMEIAVYDEALVLQGAVEVGSGQVPHRDFFWTYGPMQLWVVSALFSAFGKTILITRLYDVVIRAGIILICGLVARRLGVRPSLVVALILLETIMISTTGFFLYPVFPSILCALASTLLLTGDGATIPRWGRLLAAGVLTGVTALFRYDVGFFLLVAHGMALCLFCVQARSSPRLLTGQLLIYGIGVSLVFLPVAVGAWAVGAIPGFVHDIVTFPPSNYARMRSLPWPKPSLSLSSLLPLIVYVPFLTSVVGFCWLVFRRIDGAELDRTFKLGVTLLFLVLLFSLKGVVRVSVIHSLLALIPALVFLVFSISRDMGSRLRMPSLTVFGIAVLLVIANVLSSLRAEALRNFDRLLPSQVAGDQAGAPRTAGCATPPELRLGIVDRDTLSAICYIAKYTRPNESIFVGAGRHDKIIINNVAIYYFSNRRPGTRWYHLEPGLQTTAHIQNDIIDDIIRNDVRVIVLDDELDGVREPNDSAISSGICLLDRFIRRQYREAARFGSITILRREGAGMRPQNLPISCDSPEPVLDPARGRVDRK